MFVFRVPFLTKISWQGSVKLSLMFVAMNLPQTPVTIATRSKVHHHNPFSLHFRARQTSRHMNELLLQLNITVFIQKHILMYVRHVLRLIFFALFSSYYAHSLTRLGNKLHWLRRKSIWLMSPWSMINLNQIVNYSTWWCVTFSFSLFDVKRMCPNICCVEYWLQ